MITRYDSSRINYTLFAKYCLFLREVVTCEHSSMMFRQPSMYRGSENTALERITCLVSYSKSEEDIVSVQMNQ